MAHHDVTVLFRKVSGFSFSTPQNGQQFCNIISYYFQIHETNYGQSAVCMSVQVFFMRNSPNISYISFQSGLIKN